VKGLTKLSDLCWEGLTLKHVSHRKIVVPYLMFTFTALLFELFLIVIYGITACLLYKYGLSPNLVFYISGLVLTIMLGLTTTVLVSIIRNGRITC